MNCFGIRGQLQPGATKTACNPFNKDCTLQTVEKGKEAKETSGEKLEKGVATAPAGACRSGATPPLRISAQTPLFHLK